MSFDATITISGNFILNVKKMFVLGKRLCFFVLQRYSEKILHLEDEIEQLRKVNKEISTFNPEKLIKIKWLT